MPQLTDTQEKWLFLLPILPGLLSLFGSSMILQIVYKVYKVRNGLSTYERLLIGMSGFDLIASIYLPTNSFFMPSYTNRVWAFGNDATCNFVGFTWMWNLTPVCYNACLSYYYCFTVVGNMSDQSLAQRFEGLMHVISLGYPFGAATAGLLLGLYNPFRVVIGCGMTRPYSCFSEDLSTVNPDNGDDECNELLLPYIYLGIPFTLAGMSIVINNILIWWFVRRTIFNSIKNRNKDGENFSSSGSNDPKLRKLRAVRTQALFYVATVTLCFLWQVVMQNITTSGRITRENESNIYPIMVANAIFAPLQGFFNFLVFARPTYIRIRQAYPDKSRYFAFQQIIFRHPMTIRTYYTRHNSTAFRRGSFQRRESFGPVIRDGDATPSAIFGKVSSYFFSKSPDKDTTDAKQNAAPDTVPWRKREEDVRYYRPAESMMKAAAIVKELDDEQQNHIKIDQTGDDVDDNEPVSTISFEEEKEEITGDTEPRPSMWRKSDDGISKGSRGRIGSMMESETSTVVA